ncbi:MULTISPECIES: MFS transporter [Pseudomonas syringae group]|uniref:MFS transporter n=4 Tax=Pseudomonas syringae group TaxID=136849 RepID=A0AAD0GQP7_9PSED|nr:MULTISPECIES: MFS transporter [Pseudomonas syringae group]AVB20317.1 MFS transporter [Pseudomonas avellanae]EGH13151.1 major facilitator transporter [Pseudomonas amygdali pv. morsprunorum str. M302280]KWS60735.1 MFS transporter [Pseudomonas amygdali pv. morsprunorum]PHN49104.1 MFS transporter [Pseudomonas avellanae]POC81608.1 MFS transporter [Pseudomonas avellanae]
MSSTHLNQTPIAVYRTAWIVAAIFILSNAATPLYSSWQQSLGFASGMLTIIFACYIIGLLLALTVAGQLSDHYGRKALLLPCVGLAIVAAILFDQADSTGVLMLARFITGVSVGLVVSGGMANVVEHAQPHRKHLASLLASVAMVAGAGTGPLLAGVVAQYFPNPIHTVFRIEIVILCVALLALLNQKNLKPGVGSFKPRLPTVGRQNLGIVLLGIAFFGPGITSTSFILSLGPKLIGIFLGVNSPLVTGCMAFSMFFVAVAVQFASNKLSNRPVFLLSGLATISSMIFVWIALATGSAPCLITSALLAGAGQGLGQLGGLTLIAENVPAQRRAEANAVFNMGGYVPAGTIPVVTGYLIDFWGLSIGIYALAFCIASLASLALMHLWRGAPNQGQACTDGAS